MSHTRTILGDRAGRGHVVLCGMSHPQGKAQECWDTCASCRWVGFGGVGGGEGGGRGSHLFNYPQALNHSLGLPITETCRWGHCCSPAYATLSPVAPPPCYALPPSSPLTSYEFRRWGNSRSPAYGTLSDYQFMRRHQSSDKRKKEATAAWGDNIASEADVIDVFVKYCKVGGGVSAYVCGGGGGQQGRQQHGVTTSPARLTSSTCLSSTAR